MRQYFPKNKLLYVDDDEASIILALEVLNGTNINIVNACTAQQAISLFREKNQEIGLVILDIHLPGTDGFSLLKQIRLINPHIPTIALSAMEPIFLARNCKTAGFNAYLSKPVNVDMLLGIIFSYMSAPVIVGQSH